MSDLIDRQAAIYAIEKRMDDITCEEFAEGMSEAITEISLLPSSKETMELQTRKPTNFPAVEPKPAIIRCKDCIHWGSRPNHSAPPMYHSCAALNVYTNAGCFCSLAERKQDG